MRHHSSALCSQHGLLRARHGPASLAHLWGEGQVKECSSLLNHSQGTRHLTAPPPLHRGTARSACTVLHPHGVREDAHVGGGGQQSRRRGSGGSGECWARRAHMRKQGWCVRRSAAPLSRTPLDPPRWPHSTVGPCRGECGRMKLNVQGRGEAGCGRGVPEMVMWGGVFRHLLLPSMEHSLHPRAGTPQQGAWEHLCTGGGELAHRAWEREGAEGVHHGF